MRRSDIRAGPSGSAGWPTARLRPQLQREQPVPTKEARLRCLHDRPSLRLRARPRQRRRRSQSAVRPRAWARGESPASPSDAVRGAPARRPGSAERRRDRVASETPESNDTQSSAPAPSLHLLSAREREYRSRHIRARTSERTPLSAGAGRRLALRKSGHKERGRTRGARTPGPMDGPVRDGWRGPGQQRRCSNRRSNMSGSSQIQARQSPANTGVLDVPERVRAIS